MTLDEFLDKLYSYRAKRAEELDEYPPEERWEKMNEPGLEIARELGLKIVSPWEKMLSK